MLYRGASFDMMRPASSRKQASKKHYPVVGFPSGQREQTVNLPSSTSKVRILPPPPSLPNNPKIIIKLNRIRCCRPGKAQPPPGDRSQKPEAYIGGKRRFTGELFTIDVLHWACSARPSSSTSSCSIDRTTSLITKQSSPVTLSLSIHSGIA